MHFCLGAMTTQAESIHSDLQRGQAFTAHTTLNTEERTTNTTRMQIQIPADRNSGTRPRVTQMLSYKFVEICSTRLITS